MIIAFISTHEYIKVKDDCQQEKIVIIICTLWRFIWEDS